MDCTTTSSVKEAALRLASEGVPIALCRNKRPIGEQWPHATWTEEAIEREFARNPDLQVGIILGKRSGFIDIEADSPEEEEVYRELVDGQEPPVTVTYESTRGKHRLYQWDERLEAIGKAVLYYRGTNGAKLGIRIGAGDKGAQSVVPPSKGRKWLVSPQDCEPAQLPDGVVQRILAQHQATRTSNGGANGQPTHEAGEADTGATSGRVKRAVAAIRRMDMQDGNDGSSRLYACACRCVEHDLTDAQAVQAVREYEQAKPFPKAWTDAEIVQRVRDAETKTERGKAVAITNYDLVEVSGTDGKPKTVRVPKGMPEIIDGINAHTGGWPRSLDGVLFVDDPKHGLSIFDRTPTARLFGWLRRQANVDWVDGGRYVGGAELVAELERTSQRYDGIERSPHEPPIAQLYYRCGVPTAGDGAHLRQLLDRFRPETTIDRDLIQAAIMSVFWGGPAGSRPAFVITSDAGRGVGKTKLAEIIAHLAGGYVDISLGESIEKVKERLLSPVGMTKRVAILDNVKTKRLSWAELEGLITTPVISGKRMYVGEGQRPNYLTWLLTLNGVSLATDMAQRSVIIRLVRGANHGTWYEDTLRFIDKHRQDLIADVIGALRADRYDLHEYTRWATWEHDVLCRLPEPAEAQRVIVERQLVTNAELDEADILQDYFSGQLEKLGYDSERDQVRIQVQTVGKWYNAAMNEQAKTAAISKSLKQMIDEGQARRLSVDTSRTHGRCFVWTGESADVLNDQILNDLPQRLANASHLF